MFNQENPEIALVVHGMQNDYCEGGVLAIHNLSRLVRKVNALTKFFSKHVVFTQEWHPANHISFASQHPGKRPYDVIELDDGRQQTLWPDHCVQETKGAEFHPSIDTSNAVKILQTGTQQNLDAYSAFYEADRTTPTGLADFLRQRDVSVVAVCGQPTDFGISFTMLDAIKDGFQAMFVHGATRGRNDTPKNLEKVQKRLSGNKILAVLYEEIGPHYEE